MNSIEELKSYFFEKQYISAKIITLKSNKSILETIRKNEIFSKNMVQEISVSNEGEEKEIKMVLDKMLNIENKIKLLSVPYRNILFYKYILGEDFKKISQKLDYSLKRIYQLHQTALEQYKTISNN